jgi:hypothetical protein
MVVFGTSYTAAHLEWQKLFDLLSVQPLIPESANALFLRKSDSYLLQNIAAKVKMQTE